jgi:hypothetical protein
MIRRLLLVLLVALLSLSAIASIVLTIRQMVRSFAGPLTRIPPAAPRRNDRALA